MEQLKNLTKEAGVFFRENGVKMSYKKGQLFFRPEDSAQGIYYLESGQVMAYSMKENGTEHIIGIWEEGAIFGKIGTIISQPLTIISTQAITDCEVYRLDCKEFQHLLDINRKISEAYMKQVSFNNVYILNQVLVLGERDIYIKVLSQILLMAGYYGSEVDSEVILRISLTQEQMANMLCISREYLSKTLKKIKIKKLVTINGHGQMKIPNIKKIEEEIRKEGQIF